MTTLILAALTAFLWLVRIVVTPAGTLGAEIVAGVASALSALLAARIVERFVFLPRAQSERLRTILRILLYASAAAVWARLYLQADITGLLATSAVASLILGLALQTTLGNLFAGLSLELERPVRRGDVVATGDREGEVVALRWRSVHLETTNATRLVVPNSAFAGAIAEVYPRGRPVRLAAPFNVSSDIPPAEVIATADAALASGVEGVLRAPAPSTVLISMSAEFGALRYAARFHIDDLPERDAIRSAVQVRLWYALSRIGAGIAPRKSHSGEDDAAAPRPQKSEGLFGPGEVIDLKGADARLIGGAARLVLPVEEAQVARDVAQMREGRAVGAGAMANAEREAALAGEAAAVMLGPMAYDLAWRYAGLTDDPFLLWRALASHARNEAERARLLARAAPAPSRRLQPGALISAGAGWPLAEGWAKVERVEREP